MHHFQLLLVAMLISMATSCYNSKIVAIKPQTLNEALPKDCDGFRAFVEGHIYFHKEKKFYIFNAPLLKEMSQTYKECIKNMSKTQLIGLFGTPTFSTENSISYVLTDTPELTYFGTNEFKTLQFRFGRLAGWGINGTYEWQLFLEKNPPPTLDTITLKEYKTLPLPCQSLINIVDDYFFYSKKHQHYVISNLPLQGLFRRDYERYMKSCINYLTAHQIKAIFGEPNATKQNELYYFLSDKVSPTSPNYIPSLYFKIGSDGYIEERGYVGYLLEE